MAKRSYDLRNNNDRVYTGLVLLLVGGTILLQRLGVQFPEWLVSWPMLIILIGLISGFKHQFRGASWLIILVFGTIFLSDKFFADWDLKDLIWPIGIMVVGLLFMLRPKKNALNIRSKWRKEESEASNIDSVSNDAETSSEDYINSTTVFGGAKKVITSKNFKGGEIVCFMGGSEVNLIQADIQGPIFLEVTMVFGGTKLLVPPNWEVRSESVAVFAGIEDKRAIHPGSIFDPNKVLIIRGTSVFGGIEIKSY